MLPLNITAPVQIEVCTDLPNVVVVLQRLLQSRDPEVEVVGPLVLLVLDNAGLDDGMRVGLSSVHPRLRPAGVSDRQREGYPKHSPLIQPLHPLASMPSPMHWPLMKMVVAMGRGNSASLSRAKERQPVGGREEEGGMRALSDLLGGMRATVQRCLTHLKWSCTRESGTWMRPSYSRGRALLLAALEAGLRYDQVGGEPEGGRCCGRRWKQACVAWSAHTQEGGRGTWCVYIQHPQSDREPGMPTVSTHQRH